jgi:hypothetical protein
MLARTLLLVAVLVVAAGAACGSSTDGVTPPAGAGDAGAEASGVADAGEDGAPASGDGATTTDAPAPDGAADAGATPGWNLVAIDTPLRTYVDYVEVPASGVWRPETHGWPLLAQWEKQQTATAVRFQPFTPGATLSAAQIARLLPIAAPAPRSISITDAPYSAKPSPADATAAIQAALDAAAAMATQASPVDVLVPPGTFDHSGVLTVGKDVRLRRAPADTGGILHATNAATSAVHLAGDRSGALFLVLNAEGAARDTTPEAGGIWIGAANAGQAFVHDTVVIGTVVQQPAAAHVFAIGEEGGLWAFNDAHAGYADSFHHTGGSRFCQVVGNRTQTAADRGDDLYAFVGYQADGDPVHHCACIANWGRDGHARGLSAVGAGFVTFQNNDIDRTQWAGVYLAQETSYATYGTFDVFVTGNTIAHANLNGSHDGLLAYADDPAGSHASATFGSLSSKVVRLTIHGNALSDTAAGVGNGFGVEIRASVDTGDISGNTLSRNKAPQLVVSGTNFTQSANTLVP